MAVSYGSDAAVLSAKREVSRGYWRVRDKTVVLVTSSAAFACRDANAGKRRPYCQRAVWSLGSGALVAAFGARRLARGDRREHVVLDGLLRDHPFGDGGVGADG